MRILIDECAPRALKKHLMNHGHECRTVQEAGWFGKQNGELLRLAEDAFDVLVTVDTNLSYQQNLVGRRIAIVVLQSSGVPPATLPGVGFALEKSSPGRLFRSAVRAEPRMALNLDP